MYYKETKQSLKTKENRRKIIEATTLLMRERGFDNTSIRDICKEAGISTGSFYNIFNSKEELLPVVFDTARVYFDICDIDPETDSLETLAEKYVSHYRELLSNSGFEQFCDVIFSPKKGNRLFFKNDHPGILYLTKALEKYRDAGIIRNDIDIHDLADELTAAGLGALYYAMCSDNESVFYKMTEDMLAGILRKAASGE